MMMPNAAAGEIAIDLRAHGPGLAPATACASGATALATAHDLLAAGRCDIVVAGGAESVLTPLVVAAFAQLGALSTRTGDPAGASRPFAPDRDGFVLGEGAGVLVLERAAHAAARGPAHGPYSPGPGPPPTPTTPPPPTPRAAVRGAPPRPPWTRRAGPRTRSITSTPMAPPPRSTTRWRPR